jgi:hypothetical protein
MQPLLPIITLIFGNLFLCSVAFPQQPQPPCQICNNIAPPPAAPGGYPGGGSGSSDSSSFALPPPPSSGSSSGAEAGCPVMEVSPGQYKAVCGGAQPSVQSEHILWLTQDGGKPQVVDIVVPNYKIVELIKAGFKPGSASESQINVLLKKPETTVDAQVDKPQTLQGPPIVKLKYEDVTKQLVHFPNDKPYSPLTGPILPPLAGGGASSSSSASVTSNAGRIQRQVFPQSWQQQQQRQQAPRRFQ